MSAKCKFGSGVIAVVAWLMLSGGAFACSCAPPPATPEEVLRSTPVIFWGRAIGVSESQGLRTYIVELWGGNSALPVTISVKTAIHSAACGVDLPMYEPDLIAGSAKDGNVYANLCARCWVAKHKPAIIDLLQACRPFEPCPAR